jgi:hypothetical protein
MIATPGAEKNNGLIATDVRAIAINPSNTVFAGTYGLAFFDQVIGARTWEKINKGLLSAISFNGHIFARADSVGGAGDVYRSTANKRELGRNQPRRVTVAVSVLAINARDHILREHLPEAPLAAYSARDVMVIVRRREQWPGMRKARVTGNQSG